MSNLISGLIAISLIMVFLVYYAVKLNSVALWIIIVANMGFLLFDFIQSLKEENNQTGK